MVAVALVTACDTTSSFSPSQQRWGFVYLNALKTNGGDNVIAPNAQFFRGSITSVPDARLRTDSCFAVGDYTPPTQGGITGVTFLDAGTSISAKIGAVTTEIPRNNAAVTSYALPAGTTIAYNPGDSAIITVPGVAGGFPSAEIRSRTSEPFTIGTITPSTTAIPLTWSAASDNNSAPPRLAAVHPFGGERAHAGDSLRLYRRRRRLDPASAAPGLLGVDQREPGGGRDPAAHGDPADRRRDIRSDLDVSAADADPLNERRDAASGAG